MGLTAPQAAAHINRLYSELSKRRPNVGRWESYFKGDHRLKFASPEWQQFHHDRFAGFADNWCGVVGSAAPDRTEFYGLRLGDDAEVMSDDERALWRDWEAVGGPEKAAQGLLTSSYASTSFALVWGRADGEPLLTWERPDQAIVEYDAETGDPLRGLKSWLDEDGEHATLYEGGEELWRMSRPKSYAGSTGLIVPASYSQMAGGWAERSGAPVWSPNPLGLLPLVEFPNRPLLAAASSFGHEPVSEISGTAAMQDAINLMWAYLFSAADWASMPGRVVMGQEPPKMPILDENGQKIGEKAVDVEALKQGRLLWLTGQNTTIGQWEAAKLDIFTSVVNVMLRHVSAQTSTPIYLIHGELGNVNGETLQGLDSALVTKVRRGNKFRTRPTREVFRRLAMVRNNRAVAELCRTADVQWKNPATLLDSQVSDAALKDKHIGWPLAAILERRYGMSQPEIDRVMRQRDAEALADPELAAIGKLAGGGAVAG